MSLQAFNLGCLRGERLLWRNLSFDLSLGKILQITGANGCGKSSLLRILAGFARPLSGVVHWQGQVIYSQLNHYQQQLDYLGHQIAIKNDLTVKENLEFSERTHQKNLCQSALKAMGLSSQINYYGYQLSQGQKQRLALARLLLNQSKLWILDEPLSGLDDEMIEQLQIIFSHHIKQGGMIVLSTHRPLTSPDLSNQVSHLNLC